MPDWFLLRIATIFAATVFISGKKILEAYNLCRQVLSQLGEEIPESLHQNQVSKMVEVTSKMVERISDKELLEMKEMNGRLSISMNFYSIMGTAAYFGKPEMISFIACKMVGLTMENGLCKHSIIGLVQFAVVLCSDKMAKKGIESASRIGKATMSCYRERYQTAEILSRLYTVYYCFIAPFTEPLQTCADMLRKGFDAGMSLGESGMAFLNSGIHIRCTLLAGDRLPTLLEKLDYYLKLANTYQDENLKEPLSLLRETISILINNGGTSSSSRHSIDVPTDSVNAKVLGVIYFQGAIRAFWQGHSERCRYYTEKFFLNMTSDSFDVRLKFIKFIEGLNSYQLMKRRPSKKLTSISKKAIKVLNGAASHSSWNFRNKVRYNQSVYFDGLVCCFRFWCMIFLNRFLHLHLLQYFSQVHLLEAEHFSIQNNNLEAQESYTAAINSARLCGFIHEQGLACELAGYHYKKVCDYSSAWSFFDQAKRCYTEWGSQMKVDSVTCQIDSLSDFMRDGPSL